MDQVSTAQVLEASVDLLEDRKVDYFLIGGIAAGIWGEPRYTVDADFVIILPPEKALPFLRAARERGFEVDEQLALMNLDVSGAARLDYRNRFADVIVGESEFDRAALGRRRRIRLFDRDVWVASPEDVILYKLVALRDRDIDDIRRILARQGGSIDRRHLERWAAILGEVIQNPAIPAKLKELLA